MWIWTFLCCMLLVHVHVHVSLHVKLNATIFYVDLHTAMIGSVWNKTKTIKLFSDSSLQKIKKECNYVKCHHAVD